MVRITFDNNIKGKNNMKKYALLGTAVLMTITLFGRVSGQTNTALQTRLASMHTLTAAELKIIMPPPPQPRLTVTNRMVRSAAALTVGATLLSQQLGSAQPMDQTQAPPTYNAIDLGALGEPQYYYSTSYAYGINNSGQVVGYSTTSAGWEHAFLYSGKGPMQDLGTLNGSLDTSIAYAINNNGQVVGYSQPSGGFLDAFRYSNGSMQDLGTLPGDIESYAYGINDSGQVVGYGTLDHAFLYSGNGPMQDLKTLFGGSLSQAYGINNSGQVVGIMTNGHAFRLSNGSVQDLGTLPGGDSSMASSINNSGQVAGRSNTNNASIYHAFLYSGNGPMQDLGTLPGSPTTFADAINNSGQVVGGSWTSSRAIYHAFLYYGNQMYDLNTLLFNTSSGWTLQEATGINDAGQIVGYGINPGGQTHAFLLNPLLPGVTTATANNQTSTPTYGTVPAAQTGQDSLVFITHGWIDKGQESVQIPEATNFVESTSNLVAQYLTSHSLNNWYVYGYLWINQADIPLRSGGPETALNNAEGQGTMLGDSIIQGGWKHVHFIAHSAGAGMIQNATKEIRAKVGYTITIHSTFLDAYDGIIGGNTGVYGYQADWAESYSVQDPEKRWGWTGRILPNAYNVDVTALDPTAVSTVPWYVSATDPSSPCLAIGDSRHGWPPIFYSNSIVGAINGSLSTVFEGSGYYNLGYSMGFPLSEEAGPGNWSFATSTYKAGNDPALSLGPQGGNCMQNLEGSLAQTYTGPTPGFLSPVTIENSGLGTLNTSPGYLQASSGLPSVPQGMAQGFADPQDSTNDLSVWIATIVTDTNALNFVSFDAEYTSATGSDGLFTVYLDTNMIGLIDEIAVQPGFQHYDLSFQNTAPNTSHVIGFHLDPFTSVQSSIIVTNIVLGCSGVSQPPVLSITTNTSNGLLVYQLTGQLGSYNVQASTDLVTWTNIAVLANTNGTVQFTDQNSTNYPRRFYQAVAPTGLSQ
jgi:probable HAF family extracellular repeat protein